MTKNIELKNFQAKDFMGINSDSPVVIDFTQARKGQGVVRLSGDQGVGKSSTITGLMYMMGAAFDFDTKTFFNLDDDAVDVKMDFSYEGDEYSVVANGTRFVLKRMYRDKWNIESEPKATLRKIFGNLGVSPMFLKEKSGKDQIKWVKETFGVEEEASKKEIKLTSSLKELEINRREVNRELKSIKAAIESEPMYMDYEKSQERFKSAPSAKKEKEIYDAALERKTKYDNSFSELARLKTDLSIKNNEIASLEKQLESKKKEADDLANRVKNGEKWVSENKSAVKDFELASDSWIYLSKTLAEYERWKTVLKKEKELTEMQDAVNIANDKIDSIRKDLLKLTKTYLPDVDGLEIKVKAGLDDEEEGIYYNGKTLAQLSESELWDLFADHIWPAKGVQFIFCENISSLGSNAIKTMNRLVKEKKAQIFATEMDRSSKGLSISFATKID